MATKKPTTKTVAPNQPRDYDVLKKFPFMGKRYRPEQTATMTPSQAAYFIQNGILKEKGEK